MTNNEVIEVLTKEVAQLTDEVAFAAVHQSMSTYKRKLRALRETFNALERFKAREENE